MNRPDLIRIFHALGFEEVKPYKDDEINFRCPFHESPEWRSKSPSAFVQLSKKFFHCFACGMKMGLRQFFIMYKVDGDFISYATIKELKFKYVNIEGYEKRKFELDPGTLEFGMKLLKDSGDYRLYRGVTKYLTGRLGQGFRIPPDLKIKKHDDRNTLVIKGVEPSVTERFPKDSPIRFMNYGPACIFHHYYSPVDDLVVTEGLFDYLKIYNLGLNCCALMTSKLGELKMRQIDTIARKRVILFLDNDEAGRSGERQIERRLLALGKRVVKVSYEGRDDLTDPGDIPYNTLKEMLSKVI